MKFDLHIQKMLQNYPAKTPELDKLREVLQQAALLGLARNNFFEHAVFYGGTALRILYGLDRYSEDLDFSLINPNPKFDFKPFIEGMHNELQGMGFDLQIQVNKLNLETGIWSAFLKANTLSLLLSIQNTSIKSKIHPQQKLQIKLEIDTDPPSGHFPFESKLVINPVPFYVGTYAKSDLFAGKMHAALCRKWQTRIKGRDWYDLIWYIQNNTPVHLEHLRARMKQTGHLKKEEQFGRKELIQHLHQRIKSIDWNAAKADIIPFVSDESKLSLWSAQFFHDLVDLLRTNED